MANHIAIGISQLSQDINGNTTKIRVTLIANFLWWARSTMTSSANVVIDGESINFTAPTYDVPTGGNLTIGTFDKNIAHNADGTRSVSVSSSWSPPFVSPTGAKFTGSATLTLSTIPRASSFGVSGNTLGSPLTVNITRASTNFTHTVRYHFGSIVKDFTGQTTSCVFTPPITDASQIPNAVFGQGTITVFTYSGAILIGTKAAPVTLNLPASILPTFTALNITRVDNGVPTAFGCFVQNKSKANLSITGAVGIYGSTIKSYKITGGGFSADASTLNTGVLSTSGTVTFTATISDSRGRTVTKNVSIIVYENAPPSLTLKAERCTSIGVINNNGTYLKITPTYSSASVNAKNYIASKTFSISGTSHKNTTGVSGTAFILGNNDIAISKSYDVTGVVTDALNQTSGTITIKVSSSSVPINLRDDQKGIAFGKYSEKVDAIDSNWDIYVKGDLVTRMSKVNGYYGFPEIVDYLRTPANGLLPYQSGGVGNSYVGTTTWPFTHGNFISLTTDSISVDTIVPKEAGSIIGSHAKPFKSMYSSDWFRSVGDTGWHNGTYDGGLYMTDSTYLRSWNGKSFMTNGYYYCEGGNMCCFSPGAAIQSFTWGNSIRGYIHVNTNYGAYGITVFVSDLRLKENIRDTALQDGMNILRQIHHVQFDWIAGNEDDPDKHVHLGYVADELQEICDFLVYEVGEEKRKHININNLFPLITKGIQELDYDISLLWKFNNQCVEEILSMHKKIDQQSKEIEDQKIDINNLNKRIEEIEKLLEKLK